MAKRELRKVPFQVVVATDRAIYCDGKKLFIFRPTKPTYRTFVPLPFQPMLVRRNRPLTLSLRTRLPAQLYISMLDLLSRELL